MSIQKENITNKNIYTPNKCIPKYMKQKLTELKRTHNSTIIEPLIHYKRSA